MRNHEPLRTNARVWPLTPTIMLLTLIAVASLHGCGLLFTYDGYVDAPEDAGVDAHRHDTAPSSSSAAPSSTTASASTGSSTVASTSGDPSNTIASSGATTTSSSASGSGGSNEGGAGGSGAGGSSAGGAGGTTGSGTSSVAASSSTTNSSSSSSSSAGGSSTSSSSSGGTVCGGCSTPGCCGTVCQTQHVNGLGGFFYDCNPQGTQTEAEAFEACDSFAQANGGTQADCSPLGTACASHGIASPMLCFEQGSISICWTYMTNTPGSAPVVGYPSCATLGSWY